MTEWKQSESFNPLATKIIEAKNGEMLKFCSENDLKQVLRYAMVLVGLRANNMPTDEEKYVLINFIQSNYQNVTIAEIKLAFEMAVSGKLGIDAKCYENFSCEYFGRIMSNYIEMSRAETIVFGNKFEEAKPLEKPEFNVLKSQAIEDANWFADKISNDPKFKLLAGGLAGLYDVAKEVGILNLTIDEKKEIWTKCKGNVHESKSEGYKRFISNLIAFEVRIDQDGNFIQI